jgi:uncharacterized protein YjiS (DUF1127 family)
MPCGAPAQEHSSHPHYLSAILNFTAHCAADFASENMLPILLTLYSSAPLLSASYAGHTTVISHSRPVVALKRWAFAYITWRIATAITQLSSLSDQQLNELGLTRGEVSKDLRDAPRRALGNPSGQGALS